MEGRSYAAPIQVSQIPASPFSSACCSWDGCAITGIFPPTHPGKPAGAGFHPFQTNPGGGSLTRPWPYVTHKIPLIHLGEMLTRVWSRMSDLADLSLHLKMRLEGIICLVTKGSAPNTVKAYGACFCKFRDFVQSLEMRVEEATAAELVFYLQSTAGSLWWTRLSLHILLYLKQKDLSCFPPLSQVIIQCWNPAW